MTSNIIPLIGFYLKILRLRVLFLLPPSPPGSLVVRIWNICRNDPQVTPNHIKWVQYILIHHHGVTCHIRQTDLRISSWFLLKQLHKIHMIVTMKIKCLILFIGHIVKDMYSSFLNLPKFCSFKINYRVAEIFLYTNSSLRLIHH